MQVYISPGDRVISEYITNHSSTDDYYDEEIAGEEAFGVHFHLSSLRKGILNWYDFTPSASLLEIGAGFGALTGLFCEKCAEVTAVEESSFRAEALKKRHKQYRNLKVISGDWHRLEFNNQFDYVVIFEALQCDSKVLNQIAKLLKPSGRLLISYENCFGLKYMCGMPEHNTGRTMVGVMDYDNPGLRCSFSRKEITKALETSVFTKYKCYYPIPDARLPQVIYSDAKLPEQNVSERLMCYYEAADTLVAREEKLYGEVIEQGLFPFFANSILVECSLLGECCDVSYAALSSDRGKEGSFATIIHQSGVVSKEPLYQEGKKKAEQIYRNMMELGECGIPVVPHTCEAGKLSLPYMELPTLANYLRKTVEQDSSVFIKVLQDLYAFVLQASKEVAASQNALLPRIRKCCEGQPEQLKRLEEVKWGPIIDKAYLELIPLNCFFNENSGKYYFFDQEFIRDNYPAGYVLYRAILHSYGTIHNLETYLPLEQIKEMFGLKQVWEFYQLEEALFMDEVRLRTRYRQFYKWMFPDIGANVRKIRGREYRCGREAGKQLILFGTGKKFEDYCATQLKNDSPMFAVDNDSTKWGKIKNGIEIRPPQAILDIPRELRQILICCINTTSIEEQLHDMGVREYWRYQDVIG